MPRQNVAALANSASRCRIEPESGDGHGTITATLRLCPGVPKSRPKRKFEIWSGFGLLLIGTSINIYIYIFINFILIHVIYIYIYIHIICILLSLSLSLSLSRPLFACLPLSMAISRSQCLIPGVALKLPALNVDYSPRHSAPGVSSNSDRKRCFTCQGDPNPQSYAGCIY